MKKIKRADINTFFKSDRAILMICIGIALVFWLLVKMSQSFSSVHTCKIEYELPEGKTFTTLPPAAINATISGRGWDLVSYYFGGNHTQVSFSLDNQSNQTISATQLKDRIRGGVASVEVIELSFDYIPIILEDELSRRLPIQIDHELSYAEEFQARSEIRIIPDSVTITGPQTAIRAISNWKTSPLILKELKTSTSQQVKLVEPEQNSALRLNPQQITVEIDVEQFTERSLFIPITVKNAPDSLKIFPDKIKLSCVVGLSKYKELNSNLFTLEVDLKGIPLNTENNTVPLNLVQQPSFVRKVSYSPKAVEFFFVKKKVVVDEIAAPFQ